MLALVVMLLASSLAMLPGASASSPNYTLQGSVQTPPIGGVPRDVPAGVQVDLVSQATAAVYTTRTVTGGTFSFTTSSTGGALQPGYWGITVPAQTNVTLPGTSGPQAILSVNQTVAFSFWNASRLSSGVPITVGNVQDLPYSATITGTVTSAGNPLKNAPIQLLAPQYEGVVLSGNISNASTGKFSLLAPAGTWVLQTQDPNIPNALNTTQVTISTSTSSVTVDPIIQQQLIIGRMYQSTSTGPAPVFTSGNATLFDPTTGYIFSTTTSPGGFYQLGTYGVDFGAGANTFDLFLSAEGFATVEHTFTTSGSPTVPIFYNATLPALASGQRGNLSTTLDFTGFNNVTGTGNLTVNSTETLGNNAVVSHLPNATVQQLWSQLGLAFNHSTSIPLSLLPTFYAWINSTGPVFPAVQAGTNINGTGFKAPTAPQTFESVTNGCTTTYCGPSTTGGVTIQWSDLYALNGSVRHNSSLYTIGFGFRHPSTSADIYNYTVELPAGYTLRGGTVAPADSVLIPQGPDGSWGKFTLESLYDPTESASVNWTIVSATTFDAVVNVTVPSYFAYSSLNVLNSTRGNYTVEVGLGQNVTFSARNSIYPSGINATTDIWNFGDGTPAKTVAYNQTTYHYYSVATTGNQPFEGNLTVVGSNQYRDTTRFYVYVATGPLTAGMLTNASASENQTIDGTPYLMIDWNVPIIFNASASRAAVSPGTTNVSGILAVASYSLSAWGGFTYSPANFTASAGAYFGSNWTYQFLGAGSYLSSGLVAGQPVTFKGWQYNLTLTVWTGTGQRATSTLVILVVDTEKPTPAFQVLNINGVPVTGAAVTANANLSAHIQLDATNSTDPHNGSLVRYYWLIGVVGNGSFRIGENVSTVKPYPKFWLTARTASYWINLTVTDLNGNMGYTNQTLTVSANTTLSPILKVGNFTGPKTLTSGGAVTYWVNVTVGGGSKSVAQALTVRWYTTSVGGTSRSYLGVTTRIYNYTSPGVPNSSPMPTYRNGSLIASLAYNTTVRAEMTWTPSSTGSYDLYANATTSNEFTGNYNIPSPLNVASQAVTVNPSLSTQLIEYGAIAAVVVVVILLIVFYVRRRGRARAPKSTSRSGLERGGKRGSSDEDEEDDH